MDSVALCRSDNEPMLVAFLTCPLSLLPLDEDSLLLSGLTRPGPTMVGLGVFLVVDSVSLLPPPEVSEQGTDSRSRLVLSPSFLFPLAPGASGITAPW